jgi:hypothetical protein
LETLVSPMPSTYAWHPNSHIPALGLPLSIPCHSLWPPSGLVTVTPPWNTPRPPRSHYSCLLQNSPLPPQAPSLLGSCHPHQVYLGPGSPHLPGSFHHAVIPQMSANSFCTLGVVLRLGTQQAQDRPHSHWGPEPQRSAAPPLHAHLPSALEDPSTARVLC